GVDMSEKMMRRLDQLLSVRPRGQHVKVTIDLHGVGVDDLATEAARQCNGEFRLAACGWPVDQDSRPHASIERLDINAWTRRIRLHASSTTPCLPSAPMTLILTFVGRDGGVTSLAGKAPGGL